MTVPPEVVTLEPVGGLAEASDGGERRRGVTRSRCDGRLLYKREWAEQRNGESCKTRNGLFFPWFPRWANEFDGRLAKVMVSANVQGAQAYEFVRAAQRSYQQGFCALARSAACHKAGRGAMV